MSKRIMAVMAFGLLSATTVAACAPQTEEVVYIEPAPVAAEPVFNKYGN
ncbi:MAG: hypothetical protein ACU0AT_00085 [Tranquillimonas sp.]